MRISEALLIPYSSSRKTLSGMDLSENLLIRYHDALSFHPSAVDLFDGSQMHWITGFKVMGFVPYLPMKTTSCLLLPSVRMDGFMTFRSLLRCLVHVPLLSLPLAAQNTSRLTLEQSSNLQNWQPVPVTAGMLDSNGRILVPGNTTGSFYRMRVSAESDSTSTPTDMALIPANSFQMGNGFAEGDLDELPVHGVNLSAFYIGKYEVTKALWDSVRAWGAANGYTDLPVGGGKSAAHPVHSINWYAMIKWCNARSQRDGLTPCYTVGSEIYKTGNSDAVICNWNANGYRLPTEAEWEKAARGGLTGKRFPSGDTISHSEANYLALSSFVFDLSGLVNNYHPGYNDGITPYSAPVDDLAPNGYGLHHMAGNMWEWCWDWYDSGYYAISPGADPRGPSSGAYRVIRGGGWGYGASYCRVADRGDDSPSYFFNDIGFRLARSAVP